MCAPFLAMLGMLVAASPAGAADTIDLWAGLWRVTFQGTSSGGEDFAVLMVFDRGRFHFLPVNSPATDYVNARRIPGTRLPGGEFDDVGSSAEMPSVTGSYGVTIYPETTLIYDRLFALLGQVGFFEATIDRRTFASFAGRFQPLAGERPVTATREPAPDKKEFDEVEERLGVALPSFLRKVLTRVEKVERARLALAVQPASPSVAAGDAVEVDVVVVNRGPRPVPARAARLQVEVSPRLVAASIVAEENMEGPCSALAMAGEVAAIDCEIGPLGDVPQARVRFRATAPADLAGGRLRIVARTAARDPNAIPELLGAPAAKRVKVAGGGGGGDGVGERIDVACPPELRDRPGNVYALGRREIEGPTALGQVGVVCYYPTSPGSPEEVPLLRVDYAIDQRFFRTTGNPAYGCYEGGPGVSRTRQFLASVSHALADDVRAELERSLVQTYERGGAPCPSP